MKTTNEKEKVESLTQELRRGALPLAVLSMLNENKYGYALISELAAVGIEIDQGTLYPMLRRLEEQSLLQSSWILEGSRPRRYYQISETGLQVLTILKQEWKDLNQVIEKILAEKAIE